MFMLNNELTKPDVNRRRSVPMGLPTLAICLISLVLSSTAMATSLQVNSNTRVASENSTISREQAVTIAKQGQESKVLKVKKQQNSSGSVYKVKLLTSEGRVKQVTVNASTGRIEHKQ